MKKTIKSGLLLALAAFTTFINPLKAQDAKKELEGFTKKFQDAYNKKDDRALKIMFTRDAVRTDANGVITTGDENIRAAMVAAWTGSKPIIVIKQETAEKQADGSVIAAGTYQITGTTDAGEKLDIKGSYTNTVVKEKGKWKIAKMVLGN